MWGQTNPIGTEKGDTGNPETKLGTSTESKAETTGSSDQDGASKVTEVTYQYGEGKYTGPRLYRPWWDQAKIDLKSEMTLKPK